MLLLTILLSVSPFLNAAPQPLVKNATLKFSSRSIPFAKQGGVSCYQSPCMNGGTCFTNYNIYTTAPTTTTTTTTTSYYTYAPPLCACQAQYTGSRCELYNPQSQTTQAEGWNNLCRVYNDRNMNICQNGGQCVYVSDGKVACVCPSMFIGQYCEYPVYVQCQGLAYSQCHRDYGTCLANGTCACRDGYSGSKCDIRVQLYAQPTTASTVSPSTTCLTYYCLNGGTCRQFSADPYVACVCPINYTGPRCETLLTGPPATSSSASTVVPRCNFTISLQNDGLYTARFKLQYSIEGIQQPIYTSESLPFVGQVAAITIPYYAKDLVVTGERLGFSWTTTFVDTGINVATRCTKCYKTWGLVTSPQWDHVLC